MLNILKLFTEKLGWRTLLFIACVAVGGGYYIASGSADSAIEEAAEKLIKYQTGIDIDVSPGGDPDMPKK